SNRSWRLSGAVSTVTPCAGVVPTRVAWANAGSAVAVGSATATRARTIRIALRRADLTPIPSAPEGLQLALDGGNDLRIVGLGGRTPPHHAIVRGDEELLEVPMKDRKSVV